MAADRDEAGLLDGLYLAFGADPVGNRTIAVLTKIDLAEGNFKYVQEVLTDPNN